MKAVEFQSELSANRTLAVPADLLEEIPSGQPLRVLILLPQSEEVRAWEQLAASEFGLGYADGDAIYDNVLNR